MADLPEEVVDEAIRWVVRLGSADATEADVAACRRWRRARPEHDEAWRRLAVIERQFDKAAAVDGRSARATLDAKRVGSKRRTLKLLLLGGAGTGLGIGASQSPAFRRMLADEATAPGEQREIRFAGTGRLLMNTDTALDLDRSGPALALRRGEIYADFSDDAFAGATVTTRHARFTARGAQFALRDIGALTRLVVSEGSVQGSPIASPRETAELTTASGPIVFEPGRYAPDPETGVMDHLAWRRGLLVVEGMRLSAFAAELERYSNGFIRTRGAVGDLTVAGVFPLDDIRGVLAAIEATHPVQVRSIAGIWTDISAR
ncbi:MAG: DUF4880 domain-containing protein [Pseudomonadota bacterium]